MVIDYSVYPDLEDPPETLESIEDRSDYVARICAAWDFGIVPTEETFEAFVGWRDVFDAFPLDHSVAYHALRAWYEWPPVPANILFGQPTADTRSGRTDPCENMV